MTLTDGRAATLSDGPGELCDPALVGIEHLTGAGAAPMIDALADALGARADHFSIAQISHDPARSCTVSYAGSLWWPDGSRTDETFVATTSIDGPPAGASVVVASPVDHDAAPFDVGVWRYPFDPALPGLAHTVIPELATERYGGLLGGAVIPTVVGYRPGRRAVVRLDGPAGTVWAKVLRPSRVRRLADVHAAAVDAGLPVPALLRADVGVVVLSHLAGDTVRDRLMSGRRVGPPVLMAPVLTQLGELDLGDLRARRAPLSDVGAHVESLVATLPDQESRLRRLLERLDVERRGDHEAVGAGGIVHGDLHDAQLICPHDAGPLEPPAMLDLDDVGRGDRADDLGNMIAHASTLAGSLDSDRARPLHAWCADTRELVAALGLDPAEVARRAAAAALSLATGPLRACERDWRRRTLDRLDLADSLAREKSLRGTSRRTHPHAGEHTSCDVTAASTTGGTR